MKFSEICCILLIKFLNLINFKSYFIMMDRLLFTFLVYCVCLCLCRLGEGRVPRKISFQELHLRVGEIAAALKSFGVKQGDRIAGKNGHTQCHNIAYVSSCSGYLPNCALAVEAMLATSSLGAIWCSTSPDFGVSVSNNQVVSDNHVNTICYSTSTYGGIYTSVKINSFVLWHVILISSINLNVEI